MALSDTRRLSSAYRFAKVTAMRFSFLEDIMSDYRALYRKWRPVDFDDVSGQRAVTDILKFEVEEGKLSHAYLFCGSRGTGKTSCAKILSKAVNCLNPRNGNPCNACEACLSIDRGVATDVIEMDAASNNGVDDVRTLKDEISFTPAVLRYRVYIIDEVHMMSQSAFNALLKTLEEPPTYVIFILATTELHKLPTTIVSRCQRFDFKRMSSDVIVERLMHIAKAENIDLEEGGARVIARSAQGGMRDAISLLELCAGARVKIDEQLVLASVGSQSRDVAYKMIEAVLTADYEAVYRHVNEIVMSSMDIAVFFQELLDGYRDVMVVKTYPDAKNYLDLTDGEYEKVSSLAKRFTMAKLFYQSSLVEDAYADMTRTQGSRRSIAEVALTRMCDPRTSTSAEALAARVEELEKQLSLIKLGSPVRSAVEKSDVREQNPAEMQPTAEHEAATTDEAGANREQPAMQSTAREPYRRFSRIVERIGEVKRPLAVQFIGAEAYRAGNTFTVFMGEFFAKKLSASEPDLSIVRGVIAELEGIAPEQVALRIEAKRDTAKGAKAELDSLFN